MNLNWKQIMSTVEGDDRFYMDTEEDEVTPKEAGWEFLRMFGRDDAEDEESEEESGYSEASEQEESVSVPCCFAFCLILFSPSRANSNLSFLLSYNTSRRMMMMMRTWVLWTKVIPTTTMVTRILKNRAWIGMI